MVRRKRRIYEKKKNFFLNMFLGIDALYNHLWTQSSIRWLHVLVALGAILPTLMLFPSTFSNDNNISLSINITRMY